MPRVVLVPLLVLAANGEQFRRARLGDDLAVVTERAFGDADLVQLEHEAAWLGPRTSTNWVPLDSATGRVMGGARTAIEAAIERIAHMNFPPVAQGGGGGGGAFPAAGAEWWTQSKRGASGTQAAGGLSFHYDKDEALAAEEGTGPHPDMGRLRHPLAATITYIAAGGGCGSPTVVFNRTTPDGIVKVPPVPRNAVLVYPRRGRHVLFRGDAWHGVHGALAAGDSSCCTGEHRLTLLVNFWDSKPQELSELPTAQLEDLLREGAQSAALPRWRQDKEEGGGDDHCAALPEPRPLLPVLFEHSSPPPSLEQTNLDEGERVLFELPAAFRGGVLQCGAAENVSAEAWSVRWGGAQVHAQWYSTCDADEDCELEEGLKGLAAAAVPTPLCLVVGTAAQVGSPHAKRAVLAELRDLLARGALQVLFADTSHAGVHQMLAKKLHVEAEDAALLQPQLTFTSGAAPLVIMTDAVSWTRTAVMRRSASGASNGGDDIGAIIAIGAFARGYLERAERAKIK